MRADTKNVLKHKLVRIKDHYVNLLCDKVTKESRIFSYSTQENGREEPADINELNILIFFLCFEFCKT